MAKELTAEELAQRALNVNIVKESELRAVWGELGTHNVECEHFKQLLVRRGLLTNFQIERLLQGFRTGFFYGDYKVLYLVGAGTFARVYRATHRANNELYAIKVLRKSRSEDPEEAELFRREGELGMDLMHPNIVAIHEVISKGKVHFLVMDFVEGHNLRDFFKVRGKFDPLEATRITADVVAGLTYAFQKGVTHRDLKLSNVILSSEGVAKLVDFGLAGLGAVENEELGDGGNQRAIDYAGLERSSNVRKGDNRSDLFFCGCIYYQLLCGHPPMSETRDRAQRLNKSRFKDILPIAKIAPELPFPLVRVVNKALEFDPDRRYQTPGEMLADLKLATKRVQQHERGHSLTPLESGPLEGHDASGEARKLMIVESDTKMQDLLREVFKKRGYRVLVISDPERLFQRFYEDNKTADVLLVSAGSIGREAVATFERLREESATKNVPAVLLLGDQQGKWRDQAGVGARRAVIQMPLKSRQLREAILKVLGGAG